MHYILVAVMDKVQEALVEEALKSEPKSGPHIAPPSRRSDLVTDAVRVSYQRIQLSLHQVQCISNKERKCSMQKK